MARRERKTICFEVDSRCEPILCSPAAEAVAVAVIVVVVVNEKIHSLFRRFLRDPSKKLSPKNWAGDDAVQRFCLESGHL